LSTVSTARNSKTELLLPNQSGHTVVAITYKNGQYHPVGSPTMKYFIALLRQGTKDLSDVLRKEIEISCLDANGQRYTTLQTLECERPMMSIKVTYQGSKD